VVSGCVGFLRKFAQSLRPSPVEKALLVRKVSSFFQVKAALIPPVPHRSFLMQRDNRIDATGPERGRVRGQQAGDTNHKGHHQVRPRISCTESKYQRTEDARDKPCRGKSYYAADYEATGRRGLDQSVDAGL
jgi:hypothetical protein